MDVGVKINQYEVIEHIGRGGMADVWSARDGRLNRMVAVKTIARNMSVETSDPVALFRQEAQTIAQLEHPHILPVYDFGDYQGRLYIVMRYVSGGTLDDLVRSGPLALHRGLKLAQGIAEALDYAHSKNVVHLDIKPSNILLDSQQSPYLADFGLAAIMGPEGRVENPGSGTLLYMAPEQLIADEIDHRADVYSFALVLYRMFTGELPYGSESGLALKQLHGQGTLPKVEEYNPLLPTGVTEVLRMGTARQATERPDSLTELLDELRDVLQPETTTVLVGATHTITDEDYTADTMMDIGGMTTKPAIDSDDMELLEAVDLYFKARQTWANGQGPFLLGVTHFNIVNNYYREAARYELEIDAAGRDMMLRGALEYDIDVDYWWGQLDDDARRQVTLHAIRSENVPARIRAFHHLETLPDSSPPKIPGLIAQALQLENNAEARMAAIQTLNVRSRLMKPTNDYDIKTEMRGRLLTTRIRQAIQISPPQEWRNTVYNQDIDTLLAVTALEDDAQAVRDLAARTIGRMRSLTALRYLADEQRDGRPGALRALALVRDEAPYLPSDVSLQARMYAWLANTWRRMTEDSMGVVWRYVFAFLGAALAMGAYAFIVTRAGFEGPQAKWRNGISIGLMFGFAVGFIVIFAHEFSCRLRGFWPWPLRLVVSTVVGWFVGILVWGVFNWSFLSDPTTPWTLSKIRLGGLGMAAGFVISATLRLPGWAATIVSAAAIYFPLWFEFQQDQFDAILFFDNPDQIYTIALPVAILIAIGGHAKDLWSDVHRLLAYLRPAPVIRPPVKEEPKPQPKTPSQPAAENLKTTTVNIVDRPSPESETSQSDDEKTATIDIDDRPTLELEPVKSDDNNSADDSEN
ncbi:MAG: serine/threonine protein kinase [Chloroflexi bacterium]|nr:MAG: serine/threonine protein kinase [Chloroflexota bacterium]